MNLNNNLRNFNFLDVAFKVDKTSKAIFVFVPSLQRDLKFRIADERLLTKEGTKYQKVDLHSRREQEALGFAVDFLIDLFLR